MPRKPKQNKILGASDILKISEDMLPPKRHQSGTAPTLVIDGMNLAYMAYYAYSKLSHNGKDTSMIFGVPKILESLLKIYSPENVIVCWDGARSTKRIESLPEYKSHRKTKKKSFINQIKMLRKLLHRMGICQAYDEEIEGDDMIYMVTKRMSIMGKVIIVSGDKDFKQLINWDVSIHNPRSKFPAAESVFAFSADNYGIAIHQYIDFLILVGDKSDDIPGYPGIGPARASAFLIKFKSIKNYLTIKDSEFPGLMDKDKLKKIYHRNTLLMDLAYYNDRYNKKVKIKYFRKKQKPSFNEIKFKDICLRYNLKTMLLPSFINVFKKLTNA